MTHFRDLPESVDSNELKQCFIEFLIIYANKTNIEIVYYALSELLELAERQWHTYELLDENLKKQLSIYLESVINFEDKKIMHYILRVIPYLGMGTLFRYIIDNKGYIKNVDVLNDIAYAEKDYGDDVDNPYSGI